MIHRLGPFSLAAIVLSSGLSAIAGETTAPATRPAVLPGRTEQGKIAAAKADIAILKTMLDMFEVDNGSFPTTDQGLAALVNKPAGDYPNWHKLLDELKPDPWGHPYVYRCPGTDGRDFDVTSSGLAGASGPATKPAQP
jgi:general secretion pathway protein G